MRIAVVEDNPDDRRLTVRALRGAFPEAAVDEASDAGSLDGALQRAPQAVVTDYSLRWTTGIDVVDLVAERLPGVPVVMFTNTGSEEVAARALRHGVADYVIKRSGEFNQLPQAVRNAVVQAELRSRIELLLQQERAARLQAEEATRVREEFLATLSHELRTPLHAILSWVSLLRMRVAPAAELTRGLEVLERNSRALARLIDDLLDLSRISSGNLRLDPEPLAVASLVQQVLDEQRPAADEKSIALQYTDESGAIAWLDRTRMQQVLRNLVVNAIKFSSPGGEVRIASRCAGASLEIEISDRGRGIAPEFIPLLFERFRQADSSTTRRAGGMGIGLAIAKHLVEAHGGQIEASSDGPGKGAVFRVRLALSRSEELRSAASESALALPSLAGLRVLLVEDDADGLAVMRRTLELAQACVETAESARGAWAALERGLPDVLVSDIGLPDEDGYRLIRAVRARSEGLRRLPAIALTAYAGPQDQLRALQAGFDAHLGKPVEVDALIRAVARLGRARPQPGAPQHPVDSGS